MNVVAQLGACAECYYGAGLLRWLALIDGFWTCECGARWAERAITVRPNA